MMHMRMFETGRETGFRDMEPEEAYDLGCKDGYRKGYRDAMREASEEIGFREGDRPMDERYPERGRMGFRDDGDSSGQLWDYAGRPHNLYFRIMSSNDIAASSICVVSDSIFDRI